MTFPTHEVRVLDELGQMRVACEQRSCRSNDSSDTGNLVTEIKVVVACARSDTAWQGAVGKELTGERDVWSDGVHDGHHVASSGHRALNGRTEYIS